MADPAIRRDIAPASSHRYTDHQYDTDDAEYTGQTGDTVDTAGTARTDGTEILREVRRVRVAVVNLKGGVAKTTSAMFLATAFSRRGRTLLVDCDPQGSALSWSEYAEDDGGSLGFNVVGLPVKDVHRKLKDVASDYEHVVLDTPPGEAAIVRAALLASEVAVVAVQPREMDIDRVRPTLELLAEVEPINDISFWMLLTQVRRIAREGRDAREAMEAMGLPVLAAEIPLLARYADAFGDAVKDLGDYERAAMQLLGEE